MLTGTTTRIEGDHALVFVRADLDLAEVPAFRSEISHQLADGQHRFVVDLSECPFVDSAGFGALLGARRRAREAGGSLELVASTPSLRRLLVVAELDRIFTLHGSIADATEALAGRAMPEAP